MLGIERSLRSRRQGFVVLVAAGACILSGAAIAAPTTSSAARATNLLQLLLTTASGTNRPTVAPGAPASITAGKPIARRVRQVGEPASGCLGTVEVARNGDLRNDSQDHGK